MPHILVLFVSACFLAGGVLSAQPSLEWAVSIRDRHNGSGHSIPFLEYPRLAVGSLGEVYFTGLSASGNQKDLILGEEDLSSTGEDGTNFFVGQIDPAGRPGWIKRFSGLRYTLGNTDTSVPHVLARPSGGSLLVGTVTEAIVYGLDTLASTRNDQVMLFIGELSASGEMTSHRLLDWGQQDLDAVAYTADGDLLLTGRFQNFQAPLGDSLLTAASSPAYFVARLAPEGDVRWTKTISATEQWGTVGNAYGLLEIRSGEIAVTLGPAGRQFVINGCGDHWKPLHLALLSGASGELRYLREVAQTRFGYLSDLAEAPNGDLYLAGSQGGGIRSANGENSAAADLQDCNVVGGFILKVDPVTGAVQDLAARHDYLRGTRVVFLADESYVVSGVGKAATWHGLEGTAFGAIVSHYDRQDNLLSSEQITDYDAYRGTWVTMITTGTDEFYLSTLYGGAILGQRQISEVGVDQLLVVSKLRYEPEAVASAAPTLHVFPNPVTDILNVSSPGLPGEENTLFLYDAVGREVGFHRITAGRKQHSMDVSRLPGGTYMLRLASDGEVRSTSVIKQ
ncbi:T9SS type A sorting domain-containing protein [Lewinella sp. IMCC34191]|uniref:T9SS type A sorting domain-containing protein n=1 Tax=Lewinella sp. IMCC34191 TaxID=2259172 RepID=UPI000E249FC0|nr:T9SS type A sorting domain-containing protein [Lewinella sp. IMCC34191]